MTGKSRVEAALIYEFSHRHLARCQRSQPLGSQGYDFLTENTPDNLTRYGQYPIRTKTVGADGRLSVGCVYVGWLVVVQDR